MHRIGLAVLFGVGIVAGVGLAPVIFVWSFVKKGRAVHADGPVCRAEVAALDDVVGPRLAGPAVARLAGAFHREGAPGTDVLGLTLRFRRAGDPLRTEDDLRIGDQDVMLGTFESFATARRDRARTDVDDYLGNVYRTVAVWEVGGSDAGALTATPKAPSPVGASRLARLEAAIAAGTATFRLDAIARDGMARPVAEVRLVERLPLDGRLLRTSVFRAGRQIVATGFRNGIRAVVYPVSQLARRLRGA